LVTKTGENCIILVSDDVENRKQAQKLKISALSSLEYCQIHHHHLMPLLASFHSNVPQGKPELFSAHLAMSELTLGISEKRFLQGVLICTTSHEIGFVDSGSERIVVRGAQNINRAITGDLVVIQIIQVQAVQNKQKENFILKLGAVYEEEESDDKNDNQEREGCVVGVVRRNWKANYCGSILQSKKNEFVPVDSRIPHIKVNSLPPIVNASDRICVAIDAWPNTEAIPLGHYVTTLGTAGDKEVETQILLREHAIELSEFSAKVLTCLPPGEEYNFDPNGRVDLRESLIVCSIDPPNCRDIDDALSAVLVNKNQIEIGIHIADVTHFCKPGTALDEEARHRGTSTYLVDRRLDMLPKKLTERLCSLRPNVDRYAFSAFITLDIHSAEICGEPRFVKCIIRSRAALTYHEAQLMIQGESPNDEVAESVRRLAKMARILRKNRMARGALTLASPEVKFALANESDTPTDVGAYQLVEANTTVEEYMLLANICVANKVLSVFPGLALLRHHPEPPQERFLPLKSKASIGLNLEINTTSNLHLAKSLDAACSMIDPSNYSHKLLRCLATWCMAPARYFCAADKPKNEWQHYGLAAQVYTHFTSPIRRYADVVVHRLLAAAVGLEPLPTDVSRELVADIAAHLNHRSKAAQYAARDSVALYTRLYFKQNPQIGIEAIVVDVDPKSQIITVLVPRFGIQGKLIISSSITNLSFPAPHSASFLFQDKAFTLKVFDSLLVDVQVMSSDTNPLGEVVISRSSSTALPIYKVPPVQESNLNISDAQEDEPVSDNAEDCELIISPPAHQPPIESPLDIKRRKVAAALQHLPIAPVPAPQQQANYHGQVPAQEMIESPAAIRLPRISPAVAPRSVERRRKLESALERARKKRPCH